LTLDDDYVISAGTNLFKGRVDGTTWVQTQIIPLSGITSNVTDVDYAPGIGSTGLFISTQSNGIRRVNGDGSSEELKYNGLGLGNGWKSVDAILFKPDTYNNSLFQTAADADFFRNISTSGNVLSNGIQVYLNNGDDIQGIGYFNGGFVEVEPEMIFRHNPLANVQQHMASIPEPTALALASIGVLALLRGRYRKHGELYLPQEKNVK